jgi:D-alanyl-D-alanine endopeptidase (penicillin-binding protein 7)
MSTTRRNDRRAISSKRIIAIVILIVAPMSHSLSAYAADASHQAQARTKVAKTSPVRTTTAQRQPALKSSVALVIDQDTGSTIFEKNTDAEVPIASLTKLMTAMVVLDAQLPLSESVTIEKYDVDRLRGTKSRIPVGAKLTRGQLLHLALMSSENRAAAALARAYPGGSKNFVAAMNTKAKQLHLKRTRFADSTGLRNENVSTARELARLVEAAHSYPLIREYSTAGGSDVKLPRYAKPVTFRNTNGLVTSAQWDIGLSKTGYTSEAGRCLVMQAQIAGRPVIMVLLDSWGKHSRIGDANRLRKWLEGSASALRVAG